MRPLDAMCRTPWTVSGVAVAVVFGLGACGGDDDFANDEREPAPITLAASITPSNVTVSPSRFGAGTIELIASNLTSRSQQVTLSSKTLAAGADPLRQRTGPINPGDTASLTADLRQGTYRVTTGSEAIMPATIRVGPPRASAQDTLLQP
ncbi:MAG TPA: hypothetical protein VGV67_14010 [Solirubrobacteraceae bacterium]|nr:hypothetical protein [Solirubrobacteraceae bacterium]